MKFEMILTGGILFVLIVSVVSALFFRRYVEKKVLEHPLTGLPNWFGLRFLTDPVFEKFKKGEGINQVTVVAIELQYKKEREVLAIAKTLFGLFETDIVAHIKDNEFVLVLKDTPNEVVKKALEKIKEQGVEIVYGVGVTCVRDFGFDSLYFVATQMCEKKRKG